VIVKVTCVSPLMPLFTCVGLMVHVLNGDNWGVCQSRIIGKRSSRRHHIKRVNRGLSAGNDWMLDEGVTVKLNGRLPEPPGAQ